MAASAPCCLLLRAHSACSRQLEQIFNGSVTGELQGCASVEFQPMSNFSFTYLPQTKCAKHQTEHVICIHRNPRPPVPPFTYEDAVKKVRMAENAWNTREPNKVKMAYTVDSQWRNRSTFLKGRDEIGAFLSDKWEREQEYRLIKEIWTHSDNRIAVRFCYEYRDSTGQWYRAHGNENWEFDSDGLMAERHASINDVAIEESERKFHWPWDAARPDDHPGLTVLGL